MPSTPTRNSKRGLKRSTWIALISSCLGVSSLGQNRAESVFQNLIYKVDKKRDFRDCVQRLCWFFYLVFFVSFNAKVVWVTGWLQRTKYHMVPEEVETLGTVPEFLCSLHSIFVLLLFVRVSSKQNRSSYRNSTTRASPGIFDQKRSIKHRGDLLLRYAKCRQ